MLSLIVVILASLCGYALDCYVGNNFPIFAIVGFILSLILVLAIKSGSSSASSNVVESVADAIGDMID